MTNPHYSLTLSQSKLQNFAFVEDLTHKAEDWTRSIRYQGGYWMGTFKIRDDLRVLQDWFYNRLGYHVVERAAGGTTWEGMIYEMDLSTGNGIRRRRSLDDMYNAVRCHYVQSGGKIGTSSWSTIDDSITRYGRREQTVSGTFVSGENADQTTYRYKQESGWPWARCTGLSPTTDRNDPVLEVTVAGYVWTMNWLYMPDTWSGQSQVEDNVTVTVSDWFTTVFGTTAIVPWLNLGRMETNDITVQQYVGDYIRVWDWAQSIIERGFNTVRMSPARLWVGAGRYINYAELDKTPRYYLQGGKILSQINEYTAINPWTVQPAVIRDVEYPKYKQEPGSMLEDARDILIEEVSCDANGELSLYPAEPSFAEVWRSYSLGWREDAMRWYSLMSQIALERRREEEEAMAEDARKKALKEQENWLNQTTSPSIIEDVPLEDIGTHWQWINGQLVYIP